MAAGEQVTEWKNQCQMGSDATQAAPAVRPTRMVAAGPNDTTTLDFNAAEGDNLELSLSDSSNSYTFYAVITQRLPNGTPQTLLGANVESGTNHTFTLQHSGNGLGVSDDSMNVTCLTPTPGDQWLEWELTGTDLNCRRNGGAPTTASWDGVWSWSSLPKLGALTNVGTFAIDAEVAELILYRRALTPTEKSDIELYLTDRYGAL